MIGRGADATMATRQSIGMCIQQCENALSYAQDQYQDGSRQEHYGDETYVQSQATLQEAMNDLEKLLSSSNDQQREQLYRMRMQLQQMQYNMVRLDH